MLDIFLNTRVLAYSRSQTYSSFIKGLFYARSPTLLQRSCSVPDQFFYSSGRSYLYYRPSSMLGKVLVIVYIQTPSITCFVLRQKLDLFLIYKGFVLCQRSYSSNGLLRCQRSISMIKLFRNARYSSVLLLSQEPI